MTQEIDVRVYGTQKDETRPVRSNAMPQVEDLEHGFELAGALEPPYLPVPLLEIAEQSSILPQVIKALEVNIDAHGFRLQPVIDPYTDEADAQIAAMIRLEGVYDTNGRPRYAGGFKIELKPSPAEIAKRKQELIDEMQVEEALINAFFENCAKDISFTKLRRETREELETIGNAYWECPKDEEGFIDHFNRIPAYSMRLMPIDPNPIEVDVPCRVSACRIAPKTTLKNFRRYVQILEGNTVYFKEFGDPRTVSSRTGKYYNSPQDLALQCPDERPATEIIHFHINSFRSPYGIPRWVGVLFSVLGTTAAEDVNYLYFDNKSIPPLALLISGGHASATTVKKIEDYIETQIKGRQNFHSIMVLEAESNAAANMHSSQIRMVLQPLTSAQQQDGLFLKYIEQNRDFVSQIYRLPRIITGNIKDANRASNDAALRFAEQQVFQPERNDFDDFINRKIFLSMQWSTMKFVSNTPIASDPEVMAKMVQGLVIAGILTPEDGRRFAEKVLNADFAKIEEFWVKQPLSLSLAMVGQGMIQPKTPSTAPQTSEEVRTAQPPRGSDAPSDASENVQGIQPEMSTPTLPGQTSGGESVGLQMGQQLLKEAGYEIPSMEKIKVPVEIWSSWFPEGEKK